MAAPSIWCRKCTDFTQLKQRRIVYVRYKPVTIGRCARCNKRWNSYRPDSPGVAAARQWFYTICVLRLYYWKVLKLAGVSIGVGAVALAAYMTLALSTGWSHKGIDAAMKTYHESFHGEARTIVTTARPWLPKEVKDRIRDDLK